MSKESAAQACPTGTCANCGVPTKQVEEYPADIAGREVVLVAERCTKYRNECVNANCLQCYDFSVRSSDVSVGNVGAEGFFEAAVLRTDLGERAFDGAVRDGYLVTSDVVYGTQGAAAEEKQVVMFLATMADVKRQLTQKLR